MGALIGQSVCRLLALVREAIDSTRTGASGNSQSLLQEHVFEVKTKSKSVVADGNQPATRCDELSSNWQSILHILAGRIVYSG